MDEDEKQEVYTCTCGGKNFIIQDGAITCISCGTIYCLTITWLGKPHGPKEFNERIKQDEHGGLVANPEPPFTKRLIDKEE